MKGKRMILLIITITLAGIVDFACYTQAPYPQRAGIGRIPFVGGPLALVVYGRKKDVR